MIRRVKDENTDESWVGFPAQRVRFVEKLRYEKERRYSWMRKAITKARRLYIVGSTLDRFALANCKVGKIASRIEAFLFDNKI